MFEQLIESSEFAIPSRRPLTFLLGMMLHLTALGILILVTPLFPETLPSQLRALPILLPPLPPPPPPPKGTRPQTENSVQITTVTRTLVTPKLVPTGTTRIVDREPVVLDEPDGVPWGVQGGVRGGSNDGIWNEILAGDNGRSRIPPPPPISGSVRHAANPIMHVVVGGEIQKANLIYQVRPVYPILARQARIQGMVILAAVISPEGNVENLQVVSGHPLLIRAAVEAVTQWRYRPTLLNGHPTRVNTSITVNFSLSN
jgi:protein TonB